MALEKKIVHEEGNFLLKKEVLFFKRRVPRSPELLEEFYQSSRDHDFDQDDRKWSGVNDEVWVHIKSYMQVGSVVSLTARTRMGKKGWFHSIIKKTGDESFSSSSSSHNDFFTAHKELGHWKINDIQIVCAGEYGKIKVEIEKL